MVKAQPLSSRERRTLLFNPGNAGATGRAANPGRLIAMGWLNPKDGAMKKPKAKQKHKAATKASKRHNPGTVLMLPAAAVRALTGMRPASHSPNPKKKHKKAAHGSNPDGVAMFKKPGRLIQKPLDLLKDGLAAAGGLMATRQLPQLVLTTRNKGWVGYAANIITAFIASFGTGAAFGARAGGAALVGGGLAVIARAAEEFTPLGKHLTLSGVGDALAAGQLGAIVPGYFVFPEQRNRTTGRAVIPRDIVEAVLASLPAAATAPATLKGFGGSRYN